jgi:hypothetical protein
MYLCHVRFSYIHFSLYYLKEKYPYPFYYYSFLNIMLTKHVKFNSLRFAWLAKNNNAVMRKGATIQDQSKT